MNVFVIRTETRCLSSTLLHNKTEKVYLLTATVWIGSANFETVLTPECRL